MKLIESRGNQPLITTQA